MTAKGDPVEESIALAESLTRWSRATPMARFVILSEAKDLGVRQGLRSNSQVLRYAQDDRARRATGVARPSAYSAAIFLAAFGLRCCTLGITSFDKSSSEWRHALGLSA